MGRGKGWRGKEWRCWRVSNFSTVVSTISTHGTLCTSHGSPSPSRPPCKGAAVTLLTLASGKLRHREVKSLSQCQNSDSVGR